MPTIWALPAVVFHRVEVGASATFLLDDLTIGLAALGHGLQATHVHEVVDSFPMESDLRSMIYVVWYFVSGCMLAITARRALSN